MEATKSLLSGISNISQVADITNVIESSDDVENKSGWDFQKWGQEDPQGLEDMKNSNPSKFDTLINEYTK
jgi:hypothetical protein